MDDKPMTTMEINAFYQQLFNEYFPGKHFTVQTEFYSTKTANHYVKRKGRYLHYKISQHFDSAPERILKILFLILSSKLFRLKLKPELKKEYHSYVENHIMPDIPPSKPRISKQYTAVGSVYNLNDIFDHINQIHFSGRIKRPLIAWSLHKSYNRLGFYSDDRALLVISRIFDNRKVPANVVEYLVYHEMLHIHFPAQKINGRRRIHTPEFRKIEHSFPDYKSINIWIKKNKHRL
ncbi:MAG: hypothetical protein GF313_03940 [Caldithrix sp.]|nr:hypothetical protein [Caldithrix sp.]